jgi:hypothetical protein
MKTENGQTADIEINNPDITGPVEFQRLAITGYKINKNHIVRTEKNKAFDEATNELALLIKSLHEKDKQK